ncbi:helix-turn-helix transcriptional regulator [Streptomyces sp. NBS 14/10]|uniref:helix-turn-helix transcriptional regulator n=1 Tax=Streptomyces sp. NBS 14/10 TaxID=1945643 RepID=UPI000B7CE3E7|nr:helix-turn-helix transcriptional regulator [Streptomyces sp. NBS 14/10]KAK1181125.1 helix-turn-helix transcriptional regulator [Streptomyces sp. NBS 14/10]
MHDDALGDFLRSRRARIRPEEVGLISHGRRRVPGLRREEVAQLAGVSVDYYVRLEQGRGSNVSDAVLDAVARVLRLTEAEHSHLRDLARPKQSRGRRSGAAAREGGGRALRTGVRTLMDTMTGTPAFVLGRRMDVLAWNALADAVSGFSAMAEGERNAARHTFLDPTAREFYLDWATVAAETVAYLRLDAGRHPDDPLMASLIGELAMKNETFRRLWADHPVKEKTHGVKRMRHPVVGDLELGYETLALPGDPDQLLVAYTAVPGSAAAEKLAVLASWAASQGGADSAAEDGRAKGDKPSSSRRG